MYEILEKKDGFFRNDFYEGVHPVGFTFFDQLHKENLKRKHKDVNISDEIIMYYMSSVWDTRLVIGIDNIDNQHKEIFHLLCKLLNSMRENENHNETSKTFYKLRDCINNHLDEEEAIQKQYKYPKYKLQRKEHKKFKNGFDELEEVLNKGNVSPLYTMIMYQKVFMSYRNHMLNLDKDFGEFLLKKVRIKSNIN